MTYQIDDYYLSAEGKQLFVFCPPHELFLFSETKLQSGVTRDEKLWTL